MNISIFSNDVQWRKRLFVGAYFVALWPAALVVRGIKILFGYFMRSPGTFWKPLQQQGSGIESSRKQY